MASINALLNAASEHSDYIKGLVAIIKGNQALLENARLKGFAMDVQAIQSNICTFAYALKKALPKVE